MEKKKVELKTVIDKLIKSHPNQSKLPKKESNGKKVVDNFAFLHEKLENIQVNCFPETEKECETLLLLSASHIYEKTSTFSYEKSFKHACDINHPLAYNISNLLDISISETETLIEQVKKHDGCLLDYFHLFKNPKNALDITAFSKPIIIDTINTIADNSTFGTVVTHPAKMTHPDLKYPRICFNEASMHLDGYVKTGNSPTKFDLHINANKLKVYKFLSLLINGKPIIGHINNNRFELIAERFNVSADIAIEWIEKFNLCLSSQDERSCTLVKQVYFPTGTSYHQLSILQPSGLVFSLKEKIDDLNNRSAQGYLGRTARINEKYHEHGYSSISNLTITRHGGEHPKNISALNNKYQSYYLLNSSPPQIKRRDVNFPTKDFFTQSIRFHDIREPLQKLHTIFISGLDSPIPRRNLETGRDHRIEEVLDIILSKMISIRNISTEQYHEETSRLPHHQKVWLCHEFQEERRQQQEWLDELCETISHWVLKAYNKIVKKPIAFGPAEIDYIMEMIETHKEALR